MNGPGYASAIEAEITRLLHLAIIAQLQAWEAVGNLEALLDAEWIPGSPEHNAVRVHIADAVSELACHPDQTLIETLGWADCAALRDTLISMYEERQGILSQAAEDVEREILRLGDEGPVI